MTPEFHDGARPGRESPADPPAATVTIRCRENGPFVLETPPGIACILQVVDHRGAAFPLPTHKKAVALCRCGQSATRPFCDGSHHALGFRAAEVAPT